MVHQGVTLNRGVDPVGGEGADDDNLLLTGVAGAALNAGEQAGGVAEGGPVGLGGGGVEQVVDVGPI